MLEELSSSTHANYRPLVDKFETTIFDLYFDTFTFPHNSFLFDKKSFKKLLKANIHQNTIIV